MDHRLVNGLRRQLIRGLGGMAALGSLTSLSAVTGVGSHGRTGADADTGAGAGTGAQTRHVSIEAGWPTPRLAATWLQGTRHHVGLLKPEAGGMRVLKAVALPSRAHAVIPQPDGRVLVVARRPGDWMMRVDFSGRHAPQWCWSDGSTCFNGHVIATTDGKRLLASETDLDTGEGLLGVYAADTLELIERWPVAGIDPHQMIEGRDGALWVAVGGIEIRRETGRLKYGLDRMDSFLARLDPISGEIRQRWHLPDKRLGLRHLAETADGRIGIALQAEHADPEARQRAPVLAVLDPREGIQTIELPQGVACAGYGGSIAGAGSRLFVSCPRVGRVMQWDGSRFSGDARAGWLSPIRLNEACPLAVQTLQASGEEEQGASPRSSSSLLSPPLRPLQPMSPSQPLSSPSPAGHVGNAPRQRIWAGGLGAVVAETGHATPSSAKPQRPQRIAHPLATDFRLDNHWSVMPS
ncbi:MAG: DUF1513 domain-containing protein [Lautropia sp.]|nr:DUF1513 domain-containing protein [Lautropia sp.]